MCGVVGFAGGSYAPFLSAMVESVSHRGPDDRGEWLSPDGSVGLGHTRLAILDLDKRGRQPMSDSSGQLVIAFNGEIYNFRALRDELTSDGFAFRTETDTEVILNLWLRDGHRALQRLDGMFAFALWDGRERCITITRDSFGVKPMYVADLAPGLVFASELKALRQVPNLSVGIDPVALLNHVTYLWSPGPRTLLAGVTKLEPGTWIDVKDGQIINRGSFRPRMTVRLDTPDTPGRLRERLRQSVVDQLVSDAPVGAFLSGGLDSTILVALAREHLGPFDCFTLTSSAQQMRREGFVDDLPYARHAAQSLGVRLHAAKVGTEICDHIDYMLYHLDEPQADLAPLHVFAISRLARSMGVKVLLSGAGGDDVLAGYRRHIAIRAERYWSWLPPAVRDGIGRSTQSLPAGLPLVRRLRKAFAGAGLSGDDRVISYFRWLDPRFARGLVSADFLAYLGEVDPEVTFHDELTRVPSVNSNLARGLAIDERFFLVDHNLNYTDKLSMAAGVEVRVPFLSPGVLELAHSVSDRNLVRRTQAKWALREAARGLVPERIIERPKAGFGVPLRSWMVGPLAPWLADQLNPEVLRRRGLFDPAAVMRMRQANESGAVDASYSLLAVAFIERWLQLFVDQTPKSCTVTPPPPLEWERVV